MSNAVQNVWKHADSTPHAIALRVGKDEWSYAETRACIMRAATFLRARGARKGGRVLIVLPTSPEFVWTYYGALSLGAVAVTVNTMSAPREIEYFIRDAECDIAVGYEGSETALLPAVAATGRPCSILSPGAFSTAEVGERSSTGSYTDLPGDEPAVLLYTSGTTGSPKGAVLTHDNLLACAKSQSEVQAIGPDDRMGTALPLFHVFGQASVMSSVHHVGASLSLLRPFSGAGMIEMAAAHELTAMAGVPTMWNEMLHAETDVTAEQLGALRLCVSGGATLPLAVAAAFRERFGAQVMDGYGLSETTGTASGRRQGAPPKEGSVGSAMPGCTIAIFGPDHQPVADGVVGEVAIDGPVVMREYWNRPDATADVRAGSWFLTGDLGRMDADGDLWIVGRTKDLIIRGGYNVYPREVEEVLYSHPDVLEAAVIGVPDERLGEEIAAVVVTQPGRHVDLAALRAWLEERLSTYKVPRIYHLCDELPKGSTGKILKRALDPDAVIKDGVRVTQSR
ncbi:long-chain acyl-CoA synthetase [Nocardioides ginsengisegetis]|uniref:Long-chain acyl-CoA synthetase n=1 Tax=Nocardioides ginsengisegetis TaxID=661491 RepID=A0A7W3J227_9ACTN|nr:AMP-binding protein [Nocardioides ginsengisegetis]MBA8804857.1 long-chain acyl-CoA synthetase [Nocardioides ginsengisegetis]